MARVDVSLRLRQAILLNDLPLVQRLLKAHPSYLHNPDYADKSNTSLHLAAQWGMTEIAEYLISIGHDASPPVVDWIYSNGGNNLGISVNTDGQSPLHVAAEASQSDVVTLLCQVFPSTVKRRDHRGQTPLHLASASQIRPTTAYVLRTGVKPSPRSPEEITCITTLIASGADVNARDELGNTCLHNASAWGNLKAVRALIQAGADPLCKNNAGWTPEFYSITVQAEVYYRGLVAEWAKRRSDEEVRGGNEREKRKAMAGGSGMGAGGVRLVMQEDQDDGSDDEIRSQGEAQRGRASTSDSLRSVKSQFTTVTGGSEAGLGVSVSGVDAWN